MDSPVASSNPAVAEHSVGNVTALWVFRAYSDATYTEEQVISLCTLTMRDLQQKFSSPHIDGSLLAAWLSSVGAPACQLAPGLCEIIERRLRSKAKTTTSIGLDDARLLIYQSIREFWNSAVQRDRDAERQKLEKERAYRELLRLDDDSDADDEFRRLGCIPEVYARDRMVVRESRRLLELQKQFIAMSSASDRLRALGEKYPALLDGSGKLRS